MSGEHAAVEPAFLLNSSIKVANHHESNTAVDARHMHTTPQNLLEAVGNFRLDRLSRHTTLKMAFSTSNMASANTTLQSLIDAYTGAIKQLVFSFGLDLLVGDDGELDVEYAALLRKMEEKAGDDPRRKNICERTRQLLAPLIEYEAIPEKSAIAVAEIRGKIVATMLSFLEFPVES